MHPEKTMGLYGFKYDLTESKQGWIDRNMGNIELPNFQKILKSSDEPMKKYNSIF